MSRRAAGLSCGPVKTGRQTDLPGFAIDEPVAALGQSLKLPPVYEKRRSEIEQVLPELA